MPPLDAERGPARRAPVQNGLHDTLDPHSTGQAGRTSPGANADDFLRQFAAWQIHEHRASAAAVLDELADLIARARAGEISDLAAVHCAYMTAGVFALIERRLLAAR